MKTTIDRDAARELEIYAENTSEFYFNGVIPLIKSMARKYRAGVYDETKAVKAWENLTEYAAKLYAREFDNVKNWFCLFNAATRRAVAKTLMEYYNDNFHDELAGTL